MPKLFHYIFSLLLLHNAPSAFSQIEEEVVVDTTVVTITDHPPVEEAAEEVDTTTFALVSLQEPVAVRDIPQRRVDSLKKAEDFWYANMEPQKKKLQPQQEQPRETSFYQQQWFGNLLWMFVLFSFIGIVIWYLVSSNILIFRKSAKKILSEEEVEEPTENIFTLNYDREIAKAVDGGNYRLAVRLWYLQTLKDLSERGLIDYRYGRTNHDYVAQLYKSNHYRNFFRLTRNFEYTWYGQFDLSAEAYEMMRNDFSEFKNGLR